MKTTVVILAMVALTVAAGCKSTSERGGGAPSDQGFKIVAPASMELKQGETKTATVRLSRGDYFKQDVRLATRTSRQDVAVDPAEAVVQASDRPEVSMRVTAAPEAALGEYRVYITGTPQEGVPATVEFTVKVVAPK